MYGQYRPPRKSGISLGQMIFILIVLLFAGYMIYTSLNPDVQKYAQIQTDAIGQSYFGDALIIRSEVAYDAEGVTSVDYIAEEGSEVSPAIKICNVYSSGYNQKELMTLQNYRSQIKQKHLQLLATETTLDPRMDQMEKDVLTRAGELRVLVQGGSGNLINQEKMLAATMEIRRNYLRQKYADDQSLTRLYDDEEAQLKRIESWTKQYTAASEGIVSFYSDGFEYSLNTTNFAKFTPQEVRAMIGGYVPEKTTVQKGRTTVYRLVSKGSWNVLMLINNASWSPVEGQTYKLHLSGFDDTVVDAQVVSSTRSGGELLVRLQVYADVQPVLYMRTCEAELGEYVNSMVVPKSAIYVHEGAQGVVIVNGESRLFVPVRIIKEDGNRAFIEAVQQGLLYVGQTVLTF